MATAQALNTAQQIYIAFYQRPADPAGLRFWADQIDLAGGDLTKVINNFASSPEAVALYGPINANTIGNVVGAIYQAAFGRAPAALNPPVQSKYGPLANEAEFYTKGFAAGDFTAGSIALAVLQGAQGADAGAVLNKVQTANAFTAAVDGRALTDAAFGQGTSFAATYNSAADITAAKNYLAAVGSNPGTVPSAGQVNAFVAASIADAGDPIKNTSSSGQTIPLTSGADNRTGTAGDDTFDGSANTTNTTPNTLNPFDNINGGAGNDRIIVAQAIVDADFTGVTSVESIITNGTGVVLGAQAQRAGINSVTNTGAGTLTLAGGFTNDTLRAQLAVGSVDNVLVNNGAAGTNYRVTFTSAEVGNGNANDGSATAPQDGGLAVRFQREDGADALVGGVSRFDDEGVAFVSGDASIRFDVRDISGAARGTFQQVSLGTAAGDTLGTVPTVVGVVATGVAALGTTGIYINGGAGNDIITGSANADFLVGGAGDDQITSAGGNDSVLGGGGNDGFRESVAGLVNVDLGAGDDVARFETNTFAAAGLANTRDTVAGGDGTDTLWLTPADIAAANNPLPAGQTATVTGFELIRTGGAALANFTTANIQAGINGVVFDDATPAGGLTVGFEAGSKSVQVGAEALTIGALVGAAGGTLGGALTANAAGTAATDVLALNNGRTTGAIDVFGGQSVTAGGFETLNISSGVGATAAQTLNVVTVNASDAATNVAVTVGGSNRITIANLVSNSTGTTSVNASTLTAQNPGTATLTLTAAASAGAGSVSVTGSAGDDTVVVNGRGFVDGGNGADAITGSAANDTLLGGAGNDAITANAGNDSVDGGLGDDTVTIGANLTGADTLAGGDGRDTLATDRGYAAGAQVNVSGFEVLSLTNVAAGGQTQDMVQFINNTTFDTVAVNGFTANNGGDTLAINNALPALANLRFGANTGANNTVTFTNLVNTATNVLNLSTGVAGAVNIAGGLVLNGAGAALEQGTDTLNVSGRATGAVAADSLTIAGLTARDLDTINVTGIQSASITTADMGGTARNVTVNAATATGDFAFVGTAGTASVAFVVTGAANNANNITTGANGDTVTGGSVADTLVLAAGADVANGGGGADAITGGLGSDTIDGGEGIDTYIINDVAGDSNSAGFDRVTITTGDIVDLATAVAAVRATEFSIIGGTPAAAADLLASLRTAFLANGGNAGGANAVDAAMFQYVTGGRQFLVVDSNGDDDITAADVIVEIIGTATTLTLTGGNIAIS